MTADEVPPLSRSSLLVAHARFKADGYSLHGFQFCAVRRRPRLTIVRLVWRRCVDHDIERRSRRLPKGDARLLVWLLRLDEG